MRLDQYVAQYWPEYSRSVWQKYIERGYVSVNGAVETSTKKELGEDDQVTVNVPPEPDHSGKELPVIFENDDVIVINKPSGILTHSKGAINEEFTVADFVRPKLSEPDDGNRPGIVHRLDRETSGVLIVVKNQEAKRFLQKQFQDRKAKKEYLAIVSGTPKHTEATIDLPIARHPKKPSQFRVSPLGKPAITHYQVIKSDDLHSLMSLKPTTGRTHQLRVHTEHLGTPIVGDAVYGKEKGPIDRMALHAHSLEITLPGGERRTFVAEPPAQFQNFMNNIRRG